MILHFVQHVNRKMQYFISYLKNIQRVHMDVRVCGWEFIPANPLAQLLEAGQELAAGPI